MQFHSIQLNMPVVSSAPSLVGLSPETLAKITSVYATRLLVDGYTGPAYSLVRDSDDASMDVSFEADGTIDEAAVLAWIGAGEAEVSEWYDQKNGYFKKDRVVSNLLGVHFFKLWERLSVRNVKKIA